MEIYLSALVKYYFKPRIRIWQADGEQPFVEISNPTIDETPKTKDLAGDEVSRRLSFLANLSDTQGWSTRGLSAPVNNTNLNDEFASAAVNAEDIMESNALSDSIDNMLDRSERQVRQNAINAMNQAVQQQMVVPAKPIQPAQPVVLVQPVSVTPVTPAISPVAPVPAAAPSLTTPPVIPAAPIAPIIQSTGSPNLQAQAPQPRHNRLQVPTAQPQPQPSAPTPQLAPQPAAKPAIMDNKQTPPPAEQPRLVASDDSVIDIKLH